MDRFHNSSIRSSLRSASSADGPQAPTAAGQQPSHSPRYSPTQPNAALPELSSYSHQGDESGGWLLEDLIFLPSSSPTEPTDASFEQTLPQAWSGSMDGPTSNVFSEGPATALDMHPAVPPQPYVDPSVLSIDRTPTQHAPGGSAALFAAPQSSAFQWSHPTMPGMQEPLATAYPQMPTQGLAGGDLVRGNEGLDYGWDAASQASDWTQQDPVIPQGSVYPEPAPFIDAPLPGNAPTSMPAPSLAQPPVTPADLQASIALDQGHGKPPLDDDPDTAHHLATRHLHVGRAESHAASGNLNPEWPRERPAKKIVCTDKVLRSLCSLSSKDRAKQLQHHECVGQTGIRAVTAACAEQVGMLVSDCSPGTYKFENVVLKAGTRVGQAKSATLKSEQRLAAVYLQLQKDEDGADNLKDFHIYVPEAGPLGYSNTKDSILTSIKAQESNVRRGAKQRAAAYREKNPPPAYTFLNKDKMEKTFSSNKDLLKNLNYHYAHELDQMLRDCKEVLGEMGELDKLGNLPKEGEKKLTLERNGKKVEVVWVFKNGKTADLIFAEDKKKVEKKIRHGELSKAGKEDNARALAAAETKWETDVLANISKNHGDELKELGWSDPEHRHAVRQISLQCDAVRKTAKAGESVDKTEIDGVEQFKLTGVGPKQKTIQVLRWVEERERRELREIKFFEEGGKDKAMKSMKLFIDNSLLTRKK